MKRVFRSFILVAMTVCILALSSCSGLKLTPEMQECIDMYIAAVEKAEQRTSGHITVTSVAEDAAIEFKTTESVINCTYTVADGKVSYERFDKLDGEEVAKYTSDGEKVLAYDYDAGDWVDRTEENKAFLSSETNPLTTLSLFRVDNDKKVKTNYLSGITKRTDGELTVIEFTLKDSSVNTVLSYSKADGIVRESAGHTRSYYIDSDGMLVKVQVDALQNIVSNGQTGFYRSSMTVEIS